MSMLSTELAGALHEARAADLGEARRASQAVTARRWQRRAARLSQRAQRASRRSERAAVRARMALARAL